MRLFNQLNSASFRGVPFLLDSHELQSGRKIVVHEFPNKSDRYVEDLGGLKRTFKIRGTITEPNYKINRDALITALETAGIGTLIHPFYGTVQVVPEPYTVSESLDRLGVAIFEMTFRESSPNIFPAQSGNILSYINQLSENAAALSQLSMSSLWDVNNKFRINYQNAQSILNNFTTVLTSIPNPFNSTPSAAATYQQELTKFSNSINSLINQPSQLSSEIVGLFSSLDILTEDASQRFKSIQTLFNYSRDIPLPQNTTYARSQLIQNNLALYSQINFNALVNAYNAVSEIDFVSEEDLINAETILDNQFYYTIDNSIFDEETIYSLKDLRNQVRIFFEKNKINIRKVIVINTQQTTLTTLTYAYYNSLDNDTLISDLNRMRTPNNISGDIRMITQQ